MSIKVSEETIILFIVSWILKGIIKIPNSRLFYKINSPFSALFFNELIAKIIGRNTYDFIFRYIQADLRVVILTIIIWFLFFNFNKVHIIFHEETDLFYNLSGPVSYDDDLDLWAGKN